MEGKARDKTEDIFVQASQHPAAALAHQRNKNQVISQKSFSESLMEAPTETHWATAFPFTDHFQQSFITILSPPALPTGIWGTSVQHPWHTKLSAALGIQAKPAKQDGFRQKLEGNSLSSSGWSTADYEEEYVYSELKKNAKCYLVDFLSYTNPYFVQNFMLSWSDTGIYLIFDMLLPLQIQKIIFLLRK